LAFLNLLWASNAGTLKQRRETYGRQKKTLSDASVAEITDASQNTPVNRQGETMVCQTLLPLKLERTDEILTAYEGRPCWPSSVMGWASGG